MRCFAASASAMSTPASAYFIEDLFSCWSGTNTFPLFSLGRKWVRQPGGGPVTLYRFCREEGLKRSEQSSPAYQARMHQGIRVCKEALANLSGLPRIGRYIEGHVNHDRRTDNVIARNAVPEAAVVGIAAIVAHHKIGIRRNFVRHLQVDNRGNSYDSRFWHCVPRNDIIGTPVMIYMSLDVSPDAWQSGQIRERFFAYANALVHPGL